MLQKVLKVGTSAAVTLPKNSLAELGIKIGDSVSVAINKERQSVLIEPAGKSLPIDRELMEWTHKFIERYRPALEALAKK